ncbi:MAG: hypothetical protein LBI56_02560 [Puniceicoccales bacterium]|jgi:Lhr-like helicase|nr:hypothetical protein [Puniceicoccales bacterium]
MNKLVTMARNCYKNYSKNINSSANFGEFSIEVKAKKAGGLLGFAYRIQSLFGMNPKELTIIGQNNQSLTKTFRTAKNLTVVVPNMYKEFTQDNFKKSLEALGEIKKLNEVEPKLNAKIFMAENKNGDGVVACSAREIIESQHGDTEKSQVYNDAVLYLQTLNNRADVVILGVKKKKDECDSRIKESKLKLARAKNPATSYPLESERKQEIARHESDLKKYKEELSRTEVEINAMKSENKQFGIGAFLSKHGLTPWVPKR